MVMKYHYDRYMHMKSLLGTLAISIAAFVRVMDFASDCFIANHFRKQYNYFEGIGDTNEQSWSLVKMTYTIISLGVWAIVGGFISAIGQATVERRHSPLLSFFFGFTQIQYFVEAYDSIVYGKKTQTLKNLHTWGTLLQTAPNVIFQVYQGFEYGFEWEISLSTCAGLLNLIICLVSYQKEIFTKSEVGKLPLFSQYSVVLFVYRFFEVPTRVFAFCIYAAEFFLYVLAIAIADIFILYLIRLSSLRKKAAERQRVLNKSKVNFLQFSQSLREMRAQDQIEYENYLTDEERLSTWVLVVHFIVWMWVYMDGVDAGLYTLFRLFEMLSMSCIFLLFVDDPGIYNQTMLWIAAFFIFVYFFVAILWLYFYVNNAFLHRDRAAEIELPVNDMTSMHEDNETDDEAEYEEDEEAEAEDGKEDPEEVFEAPEPEPEQKHRDSNVQAEHSVTVQQMDTLDALMETPEMPEEEEFVFVPAPVEETVADYKPPKETVTIEVQTDPLPVVEKRRPKKGKKVTMSVQTEATSHNIHFRQSRQLVQPRQKQKDLMQRMCTTGGAPQECLIM